ncbi:hypothetical protein HDU96_010589 [Phlyctochytrium bullatum]|nr:hypothetical protein HDU96_010589 [Phlyctochytrium bullatum]
MSQPVVKKQKRSGILGWWDFLSAIPVVGNWIFNLMVAFTSPYTVLITPILPKTSPQRTHPGSIPLAFKALSPGHAVGQVHERRSIRNPFNSVHAAALINMGEAVGGMAILTYLETRSQSPAPTDGAPHHLRAIPVRLSGDFKKKARGALTAEARVTDAVMVAAAKKGDTEVVTEIKDAKGEVVCEVRALWKVSEAPPKGAARVKSA